MPEHVQDVTLEILKNIQAELSSFRSETNDRFERLETVMRKHRRDGAGMLVMMRATAGDFDERVSEVEERVAALEARSQ